MYLYVAKLAQALTSSGIRYMRVKDLAAMLGVSMRTAGKLLAAMERMGLAARWSTSAYRLADNIFRAGR